MSKAAMKLGVSQPSLSRTIRHIEDALGVALFHRTGRGVVLTPGGALLQSYAHQVIQRLGELQMSLDRLQNDFIGEVSVLLPHYVSRVLVPPFVKQFAQFFPQGILHVFEVAAAEIPERLHAGLANFGIFYQSYQGACAVPEAIAQEHIYLVSQTERASSLPCSIPFRQMAEMPLILPCRHTPFRRFIERKAAAAGHQLRVIRELEVSYSALEFVKDGEGSAILPLSHCHEELLAGAFVARPIVDPDLTRDIYFAFGSGATSKLSLETAKILKSVIAREGGTIGWLGPNRSSHVVPVIADTRGA